MNKKTLLELHRAGKLELVGANTYKKDEALEFERNVDNVVKRCGGPDKVAGRPTTILRANEVYNKFTEVVIDRHGFIRLNTTNPDNNFIYSLFYRKKQLNRGR